MKKKIKVLQSGVFNRPYFVFIGTPEQFKKWTSEKDVQQDTNLDVFLGFAAEMHDEEGLTYHLIYMNANHIDTALTSVVATIAHEAIHTVEHMYRLVFGKVLVVDGQNNEFIANALEQIVEDVSEEVFSYIEKQREKKK